MHGDATVAEETPWHDVGKQNTIPWKNVEPEISQH